MLTQSIAPRRIAHLAALGLMFLLLLASAIPAAAAPPSPAAVGNTVTWDTNPKILTNTYRANFPSVAVDGNNITHIIYIAQPAVGASWQIMYTNNAGGAFNIAGKQIDTAGTNPAAVPPVAIVAGPGNILHMVYVLFNFDGAGGNQLFYRQSTDNGASWSPRVQISDSGKSAAPNIAIDTGGNLHIVWINDKCGASIYNVFYRMRASNGTLSGITKPKDECSTFQNRPQITIAGGKPQVTFARDTSKNSEIYYARLEGNQWVNQNISSPGSEGLTSINSAIASDGGNNLFVAWDENINSNTNHEIYFKASFNGGLTWSAANNLSGNASISTQPSIAWSSTSQRAYIVWSDANGGSQEEIWEREFDPATRVTSEAFQVSKTSGHSFWPTLGFGPQRADIAWHDNSTGNYQIYDLGGSLGPPPPPGCDGTLSLENGVDVTKNSSLSGTITLKDATCGPTTMQVSVDTPPTDTNTPAPQPYSASLTNIQIPAGGCLHTVYVRIFNSTTAGPVFNDSITVDNSVDADVRAVNPNMAGLPTVYSQVAPADTLETGAKDGDPGYTRDQFFSLAINRGADCSTLATFSVLNTDLKGKSIPSDPYAQLVALPGGTNIGTKSITVIVTDTLSNQKQYPFTLVYDPPDTDPSTTVSNTLGLPVLDLGQPAPGVTGPTSTNNIKVTLSFSNIRVNDNLYGDGSGPGTNDFWGVWLANSATDVPSNSTTLMWTPIQVPTPGPSFTVDWNLFKDLTAQDQRAGNYFIYVRFLDGAGNPTQAALKTQITLTAPFVVSTNYIPTIVK